MCCSYCSALCIGLPLRRQLVDRQHPCGALLLLVVLSLLCCLTELAIPHSLICRKLTTALSLLCLPCRASFPIVDSSWCSLTSCNTRTLAQKSSGSSQRLTLVRAPRVRERVAVAPFENCWVTYAVHVGERVFIVYQCSFLSIEKELLVSCAISGIYCEECVGKFNRIFTAGASDPSKTWYRDLTLPRHCANSPPRYSPPVAWNTTLVSLAFLQSVMRLSSPFPCCPVCIVPLCCRSSSMQALSHYTRKK